MTKGNGMSRPERCWVLGPEAVVSTGDIGRRLGVSVTAKVVSGICAPAMETRNGTFWLERDFPLIAVGLAKMILASAGMSMVERNGDTRT